METLWRYQNEFNSTVMLLVGKILDGGQDDREPGASMREAPSATGRFTSAVLARQRLP